MKRCRPVLLAALLVVSTAAGACGSTDGASAGAESTATSSSAEPTTTVEVRKDLLADVVDPPGADGRTLSLMRYTIAPGAKLAPHVHPGVQMASIESGTLTYTVVSGTALVQRAGSTGRTEVSGTTTIELDAGDAVIEVGDMVHFGENLGADPVVILATLLTEDGRDLAVPVTTTAPPS